MGAGNWEFDSPHPDNLESKLGGTGHPLEAGWVSKGTVDRDHCFPQLEGKLAGSQACLENRSYLKGYVDRDHCLSPRVCLCGPCWASLVEAWNAAKPSADHRERPVLESKECVDAQLFAKQIVLHGIWFDSSALRKVSDSEKSCVREV